MKHIVQLKILAVAVMVGLVLLVPQINAQEQAAEADDVKVELDEESEILQIKILAKNGHVAWSDILRALMRSGQLDDNALKAKLPSGTLDLKLTSSRFVLLGVNTLLRPDVSLRIVPAAAGQDEAHVLVTIDQGALQDKQRSVKKRLREMLKSSAGETGAGEGFGLQLPDGWQQTDDSESLVIVLHGFNSPPSRFQKLAEAFQKAELISGIYSYPDDQPIADSAMKFSTDLKELASEHPKRTIALVTHSMGGLVSRAVVEAPELDPGNITKLIMVAPPNQGSLLANFSFGLDVLDHAFPNSQQNDVSRLYAAVADGLNEAATDLKPGSRFLRKLNARPRNPKVAYSIFLGTGGRFTQEDLENYRRQLKTAQRQSDVAGLFTPRLDKVLADLDEVVKGKGDGVVAVKRGRLEEVKDTVVLNFTHLEALQNENQLAGHELYESILTRLRR